MNQEQEVDQATEKAARTQDQSTSEKPFIERFKEALSKPVTLVIALLVFLLSIGAEYIFSRTMDAIWEVEPPEEVARLNTELQSASGQLQTASKDLELLLSRIDNSKIEDPKLQAQLEQLDNKLLSLNELVKKTSQQTDKVATISEALQDDWTRVKNKSDGWIDSVPELVLGVGEGAQLCNGLVSIGVTHVQGGRIWVTVANKKKNITAGGRLTFSDQSYSDLIGIDGKKGLFKVHCGES